MPKRRDYGTTISPYIESSLPNCTGIAGPPHSKTASAPAIAIMSAQDTSGKLEKKTQQFIEGYIYIYK